MLCENCREKLGHSHKYLIQAVNEWDADGKEAIKQKILTILAGNEQEVYELKEKVRLLELQVEALKRHIKKTE